VAHYVDGFVLPIPKDNLDDYLRIASEAAKVWPQPGLVAGIPPRGASASLATAGGRRFS